MTDGQRREAVPPQSAGDFNRIVDFIVTRHASLEQRGISVVTTTSTLVTVLLAFSGLAGRESNFTTRLKIPVEGPVALVRGRGQATSAGSKVTLWPMRSSWRTSRFLYASLC
jgi:hypothetical protein